METLYILKAIAALIVVTGLMFLALYFVKRFDLHKLAFPKHKNIVIDEIAPIDSKNKIVVVSHLDQRYILLLGSNNLLIDKLPHKIAPTFDV